MAYTRKRTTRKRLTKKLKTASKPVDKSQNSVILSLTRRLAKLEHTTVERKYITHSDAFSFGGLGALKSRMIHNYYTSGTQNGLTSAVLFGTGAPSGDYVYARYMIVDVEIQCQNPNVVLGDELSPTTYSIYMLKSRKDNDLLSFSGTLSAANALNDADIVSQNVVGQSFVNPKGWKVIKSKFGVIGGVNDTAGFGIAHRRYRFKIPINKRIMLQPAGGANPSPSALTTPQSVQDNIWFAICANGSSIDGNEPHCSLSVMLCYDDAGVN